MRVANLRKANLLKLWKVIKICFLFALIHDALTDSSAATQQTYPSTHHYGNCKCWSITTKANWSLQTMTGGWSWFRHSQPCYFPTSPCSKLFSMTFLIHVHLGFGRFDMEVKQNHEISNSWNHDQDCMNPSAGSSEATKYCDYLEEAFFPHLCCTWVLFFK